MKFCPSWHPGIITKVSSVDVHPSAHLGMRVEIEKKSVTPDAPQVYTHPTSGRLDKLFGKLDLYWGAGVDS